MKFPQPATVASMLAAASGVVGAGLAVAGVYVLAGLGWALLIGSFFALGLAAILIKGLNRG